LRFLDPPYIYNVFREDLDGFVRAIKDAISHPIQRYVNATLRSYGSWLTLLVCRYVLEEMRMSSVERRLAAILEKDWQWEATLQIS
jgi:hypothetical protein